MSLSNQLVTTSGLNPMIVGNMAHQPQPAPAATAVLKLISEGNTSILLKHRLVLGQQGQVTCQFFQDTNLDWHCQYSEHCFELKAGMILAFDGQIWQFELIQTQSQHKPAMSPKATSLQFQVSSDEEHICLTIKNHGKSTELGERVHHYPLLLLARKYKKDKKAGFDNASCGWLDIELLTKMLGVETSVLNVQLHRAKRQISRVLPGLSLLERRVGQVRLNSPTTEILRGDSLEE